MSVSRPSLLRNRGRNNNLRLDCILSALDCTLPSTERQSRLSTPGCISVLRIPHNYLLYHTHDQGPDGCGERRLYRLDSVGSDRGLRRGTATYLSEHKVLPLI
jgi:hypothetical protein